MNHYVGLDISMKETFICILNELGESVLETVCPSEPEDIFKVIDNQGIKVEKVGLETGCLTFWIAKALQKLGLPAICIESRQMATIISLKNNKTDKNDARCIAEVMRGNLYSQVHIKNQKSIEIGTLLSSRRKLVNSRTGIKNVIRGNLKAFGIRLGKSSHLNFVETVEKAMNKCSSMVLLAIRALLEVYKSLLEQINHLEKYIQEICKTNTIVQLLKTIPGVGNITALTFFSSIDDPHRFKDPRDVGAYLGLTPKQYSSGETTIQGRISKRGQNEMRMLLFECANIILTRSKKWSKLKAWALKIQRKNGIKKAEGALARKLSVVMVSMWQSGKEFEFTSRVKKEKELQAAA